MPQYYLGSSLQGWGITVTQRQAFQSGLYVGNNNPVTVAGAQGLTKTPLDQIMHIGNRRDTAPYVYSRISVDDDFFDTPFGMTGSSRINDFAAVWDDTDVLRLISGDFAGGVNNPNDGILLRSNNWGRNQVSSSVLEGAPAFTSEAITIGNDVYVAGHVAIGLNAIKSVLLKSTDKGATWDVWGFVEAAGLDMVEPAIAAVDNNTILMVIRRDNSAIWYYAILDIRTQGVVVAAKVIDGVANGLQSQGSPPCLIKLRDGRIILIYAVGNSDPSWRFYTTSNGLDWSLFGTITGDENGILGAQRYMAAIERSEAGSIFVVASEPDVQTKIQQCVVWLSAQDRVILPVNATSVLPVFCPASGTVYFDIYLTQLAIDVISPVGILVLRNTAGNTLYRFDLIAPTAGGTDIYYRNAAGNIIYSNRILYLNKEDRIRFIFNVTAQTAELRINDDSIVTGLAPYPGWPGGVPTEMAFVNLSTTATFSVRKTSVFTL